MAEDMEMFLEQVIKKTNSEEYIKILEQDREDFAKEINRLYEIIDKAKIYIKEHSTTIDYKTMKADYNLNMNDLLNILQGKE